MRRTSLTRAQALELAAVLRARREALGLPMRHLEAESGVNIATIVRLEKGTILTPQPETLKALARVLDLPVSDLFAIADWVGKGELPTFMPYLRAKYRDLPEGAACELEAFFEKLRRRHGLSGPEGHEDES
jgi:transcriptional regulator with XRE-family HTH domain